MAPNLIFAYFDQRVVAASGADVARNIRTLDAMMRLAENQFQLPKNSFDVFDRYGKIEATEDFQRALSMAQNGECLLEVREHKHYVKLRELEGQHTITVQKMQRLEGMIKASEERTEAKIEVAKDSLRVVMAGMEKKIREEIMPTLEVLCRDRSQLQKECRMLQEKISGINVNELRDIAEKAIVLKEEARACIKRVDRIEGTWNDEKQVIIEDVTRTQQELKELQRYMQGKIDVCIEADADMRREQQLANERMQLTADDMRLLTEELQRLSHQCSGALEESEELRTLLGQIREDNSYLKSQTGDVRTRIGCLEGTASEKWEGFAPGVLYFRHFHPTAKGDDVQLSANLQIATGRGFLAATGVVLGSDEGLCVADGPCRRFGTPEAFSSYYELEVDEICAAPAGAGGLYVGVALQSGEEIAAHPRREFDGWLLGGYGKALICRRGKAGVEEPDLPATFAPGAASGAADAAKEALKLLRSSMPPKPKGECREVTGNWFSEELRMGDRVGVLFRCNRDGGARLRVAVNGEVRATQIFVDAPPAEAVGFLTPILRLAGTGKSTRLCAGLQPPTRMLVD